MLKQTMIALSVLGLYIDLARAGETVSALPKEAMPEIADITGFHSVEDKANKVELRLCEADASADVARNPVALFLVITDNAPGNETQAHVWRLPNGVAKVKNVALEHSGLKVSVISDGVPDEKTGKFPEKNETIIVNYSMNKGVLSDKITVTTSSP